MLLTFPVAFWSWGICSPSKQFSMYCRSTVLRKVQLKVIEIEISGPSQENHYQSSSQGSRQNKHLAERQVQCFWVPTFERHKVWGLVGTTSWLAWAMLVMLAGTTGLQLQCALASFWAGHPIHSHRTPPQQPVLTEGVKFTQEIHASVALQQQCRWPELRATPTSKLLVTVPS